MSGPRNGYPQVNGSKCPSRSAAHCTANKKVGRGRKRKGKCGSLAPSFGQPNLLPSELALIDEISARFGFKV